MPDWTDRIQLAIPERLVEEANTLAYVLDPDIGGDQTFQGGATHSADGTGPATHVVTTVPLKQDTYDLLKNGGVFEIADALQDMADQRGRDMPGWDSSTYEDVIGSLEMEAGYKAVETGEQGVV